MNPQPKADNKLKLKVNYPYDSRPAAYPCFFPP
jgi:hypothetical protein